MTTRSQWTLRAAALACALGGLLLLLRRGEPQRGDAASASENAVSESPQSGARVAAPTSLAHGEGAALDSADGERRDPAVQARWARVFVTGRVEGARGEESKPVVIVRPRLGELGHHGSATSMAAWTYVESDGLFRADVSHCFRPEEESVLAELHVQLSSGSRLPLERFVQVTFTRADLERGGELFLPVEFELAALCKPEITVALPAGEAREVTVVALTLRGERPGDELAVWSGQVDGRTSVDLALPCSEPVMLVACATGLRPRTLRLPARASFASLELERGAAIAGRLLSGAQPHIASFTASPLGRGRARDLEVGPFTLAWMNEQFEWPMPSDRSADDGTFELDGLVPGWPYELRWRDDLEGLGADRLVTAIAGEGELTLDMGDRSVGVFLRTRVEGARRVEIELLHPNGELETLVASIPLDSPWWVRVPRGTRVRVLDSSGVALGEALAGDEARVVIEL
jgi:hypothetical protein